MPHQSLYRRFRPQRFSEVVGQPHLVRALSNAVRDDRVGHGYLLSGPRGTGKTSTARILAKALNCEVLGDDGEPCGECERCVSVAAGTSMDLIELDAASNNSVNHIREMTEKAALVSSGRRKVYLLDEVHMLSTAASNALLKTLEEPPAHVVFILATTDPQKVLPTIRSRTQQFELSLVGADEMAPHVRAVADAAGVLVDEQTVDYVVERGGGSVRDALSALDTVVAAGGIPDGRTDVHALVRALASADLAATLIAVAAAVSAGVDARDLAERTARRLRDMFLVGAGVEPAELPAAEVASARELSEVMGRRANVRALEALGEALAQMPQSADRRLTLETALVGLLADELLGADTPVPAVTARAAPVSADAPASPPPSAPSPPAPRAPTSVVAPVAAAPPPVPPPPAPSPPVPPPPPTAPAAAPTPTDPTDHPEAGRGAEPTGSLSASDLQRVWERRVVERLRPVAAGLFREVEVLNHDRNVVTVRLSDGVPIDQAQRRRNEVEAVLSDLLDQTVRLEVSEESRAAVTESFGQPASPPAAPPPDASEAAAVASPPATSEQSKVERIVERFPGSVVVHVDEDTT